MKNKYQSIRGMNDILPQDSSTWLYLEKTIINWLESYGYSQIRTPIVEPTDLFIRSIGEKTDIVEKEMYSFEDKLSQEALTLRPEGTVPTLRAVIEHHLLYQSTQRLWYIGPMFRHERPQKGRYRQFHQVGVEALGFDNPYIDAEMIMMSADLWKRLKLHNHIELQINTLGNQKERAEYKKALIAYLEGFKDELDESSKRRLYTNPLRILDTKNERIKEICLSAPQLIDYLEQDSLNHYKEWKNILDQLGIPYVENPQLVRGLDYYNLSVFEWVDKTSDSPLTFCGGGRYNGLLEELGGKPASGIGFAMGLERLISMMIHSESIPSPLSLDFYIVHLGQNTASVGLMVANQLRALGYTVKQDLQESSFKSQMQRANQSGAKMAVIIGENEVKDQKITLKNLREQEDQQSILIKDIKNIFHKK